MEKYISENDTDETSMLLKIYGHKFKELKYKMIDIEILNSNSKVVKMI